MRDYVGQLLTGKFDNKGKFIPHKMNKYSSIDQVVQNSDKSIHDVMVRENLWPHLVKIDTSIFNKSKKERELLKEMKKEHNRTLIAAGFSPDKRLNVSDPAILNA